MLVFIHQKPLRHRAVVFRSTFPQPSPPPPVTAGTAHHHRGQRALLRLDALHGLDGQRARATGAARLAHQRVAQRVQRGELGANQRGERGRARAQVAQLAGGVEPWRNEQESRERNSSERARRDAINTAAVLRMPYRLRDGIGDALHLLEQLDGASRLDHQLARRGVD
jgi:hypothetical protein